MSSELITIIGLCLSAAAFFVGRISASNTAGREAGLVAANIQHIKETTDRIERAQNDERVRVDGKFDNINNRLERISETATRAKDSASSAHKRLDGIGAPAAPAQNE